MKNKVREIRKQLKLRQEDLASYIGVSRQTINAIENEKYNPSLEIALKLAKFFDKHTEEIFLVDE